MVENFVLLGNDAAPLFTLLPEEIEVMSQSGRCECRHLDALHFDAQGDTFCRIDGCDCATSHSMNFVVRH